MTTTLSQSSRMTQVQLSRDVSGRDGKITLFDVFWIDARLAVKNKLVRGEDGEIWTVAEVYGTKLFADVDKQREAWQRWARVLS